MYEIAYNSDVIIDDPGMLGSLCVFYDRLMLPNVASNHYIELRRESDESSSLEVSAVEVTLKWEHPKKGQIISGQDIDDWESANSALFADGVIRRFDPPPSNTIKDFLGLRDPELFELLLKSPHVLTGKIDKSPYFTETTFYMIRQATLEHFLRDDLNLPSIFLTRNLSDTRRIFTALEAKSVFSYVIPKISNLHPDQFLEVRQKVSDNREGFLMHLQKLSKEVESRTKEGAPLIEIEHTARAIVEIDLIPDYIEFMRQLESEKAGFWKNVLDRSSKVLEIDAAPWTPKFWADLIRCVAMTSIDAVSSRKESLTNKHQAFHFMKKLEDYSSRIQAG